MTKIRQVGPNLWEAPEEKGVTPQFQQTEHAIEHYPNGAALRHEPLHKDKKVPLIAKSEETKDLGEM